MYVTFSKRGELDKNSVLAKFAYTATDGKKYNVDCYNLDVIISVDYRVKSHRGTIITPQTAAYIFVEAITYSPYSLYVNRFTWIIFYFSTQVADMAHDNIIITKIWLFPNNIIYFLLAKYHSSILR